MEGDVDFLREGLKVLAEALMDAEVSQHIGAVSRICKEWDKAVQSFKNRPLEGEYPYIWIDVTFPKVREGGRVQTMAFVMAIGAKNTVEREVLGFDLRTSEDGAFWLTFLRSLAVRGTARR